MTIYIRDPRYPRWCILVAVSNANGSHRTECGARLDGVEPYIISRDAPAGDTCTACRAKVDAYAAPWREDWSDE